MASSSSSPFRQLPPTPGDSATPSGPTSARPTSSSSISGAKRDSSSNRLSMQPTRRSSNVPRPIPVPEPVVVNMQNDNSRPSHSSSSGEGAPSTDSTGSGSGMAHMAQELEHARAAMAAYGNEGSPSSSPVETENLLADGALTPRTSRSPPTPPTRPIPRPRSAVETGAAMHDSASRPHSSADAWSTPRPQSANLDNLGQSPPGGNSRSHSPSADSLLRPAGHASMPRSRSSNFISSPLNPSAATVPRRPGSTTSRPPSMVLYRLAGVGDDFNPQMSSLSPPVTTSRRASRFSTMSSSTSIVSDSKFPVPVGEDGAFTPPPSGAFLPYEYDPSWDLDAPDDAEDALHAPDPPGKKEGIGAINLRGAINVCVIFTILATLIVLFAIYPIISYYDEQARNALFTGGGAVPGNGGTNPPARTTKDLIDPDTPDEALTWTASDGTPYKLVFSDEFKKDGRSFKEGDDPFWQAVDLHDGKNLDMNWYDSEHVTTKDGRLVINLEERVSNGYSYVSGMLQSWNKFCFTGGYIEVSVSLPGTAQSVGYVPQAYTMGNLARSGYQATEDGLYPYSYDACDVSTMPLQGGINALPGQRLSACTCLTEQTSGNHPGPPGEENLLRGRGAPQIDILGYLDQQASRGVVSQSMRIAPISDIPPSANAASIQSAGDAVLNPYPNTQTEQIVSALTNVPANGYTEAGVGFTTFGYQHIPNAASPANAAIHFTRDSTEMFRVTGSAFPGNDDTLGRRLISHEPMYIVLSLALSQTADLTSLTLPAKLLVDHVRVYQPDGQENQVTCDPIDYPTADYISNHPNAYTDATMLRWTDAGYTTPTSSQNFEC